MRQELRHSIRVRTLQEARIYHARSGEILYAVIHCIVRDISLNGAKITFAVCQTLPDEFDLTIIGREFRTIPSQLRWQQNGVAGVSFMKHAARSQAHYV